MIQNSSGQNALSLFDIPLARILMARRELGPQSGASAYYSDIPISLSWLDLTYLLQRLGEAEC